MELILWRHAEAEPDGPDLSRRLTANGVVQADRMARWLAPRLDDRWRIIVSPAERARQTAAALGRPFDVVDALAPGTSVAAVVAAARWPRPDEHVLVVGHQPTLGALAARLLAGEELPWPVGTGALWWISHGGGRDPVTLRAAISASLL